VLPDKPQHLFHNHHHLMSATPPPRFDAHSSKANDITANDRRCHKDENNNNNNNNNDNSKNGEDNCYRDGARECNGGIRCTPLFFIFYLFIYLFLISLLIDGIPKKLPKGRHSSCNSKVDPRHSIHCLACSRAYVATPSIARQP